MEKSSQSASNAAIETLQPEPHVQAPDKKPKARRKSVKKEVVYPPLSEQVLDLLTTNETAFYLRLRPQTLRKQHCQGKCKLRPAKINGRLLWRKAEIVDLLSAA